MITYWPGLLIVLTASSFTKSLYACKILFPFKLMFIRPVQVIETDPSTRARLATEVPTNSVLVSFSSKLLLAVSYTEYKL